MYWCVTLRDRNWIITGCFGKKRRTAGGCIRNPLDAPKHRCSATIRRGSHWQSVRTARASRTRPLPTSATKPNSGRWPTPCAALWTPPSTSTSAWASYFSSTSPTPSRSVTPSSSPSKRRGPIPKTPTSTGRRASSGCRPKHAGHT